MQKYDPRLPLPRRIVSQNYHLIEADPVAKKIFPRKNIVAGSKRGKNLGELISPTVQKQKDGSAVIGPFQPRGSYQCFKFKAGWKCDVCKHMKDGKQFVTSYHFNTKVPIRGHLTHEPHDSKQKNRWFVYLIEDLTCRKQYVGSSVDVYRRWSSHKSDCNKRLGEKSGLAAHFAAGCPEDQDQEKSNLELTLLASMDVTEEDKEAAGHISGAGCVCKLCEKLQKLEDSYMLRLGTFFFPTGLNKRDQIKQRVRTGKNTTRGI